MAPITEKFGIVAPGLGWVPAPRYILRRAVILELLADSPPGRVLEIGSGAGALLYDLARAGFYGVGVEQSPRALAVARQLLADVPAFEVLSVLPEGQERSYDYVLAFEVLEHIEDDQAALITWANYLKPEGTLMISVPAHHRRWTESDVWAGHYRRYERTEIIERIKNAGFEIVRAYNYGWPLSNLIERIRAWVHRRQLKYAADARLDFPDKQTNTARSGIERTVEVRLYPLYGNWLGVAVFSCCISLQRAVYSADLGTGYLVVARKR